MGCAVVTGASSGIAAVYIDRLAERGYDLVLVARSADKPAAIAERIGTKTGREVDILPADLCKASNLARVEAFLRDTPDIPLLVNNAGLGGALKLVDPDPADRLPASTTASKTCIAPKRSIRPHPPSLAVAALRRDAYPVIGSAACRSRRIVAQLRLASGNRCGFGAWP